MKGETKTFFHFCVAFVCPIVYFLCARCAPETSRFETAIDYHDERLERVRSRGETVIVMPVLTADGPDTASVFSFDSLAGLLDSEAGRFTVLSGEEVVDGFSRGSGDIASADLYRWLHAGAVDSLRKRRELWRAVPAGYMLVVKVRTGARITTFARDEKLRLGLEAELWDTRQRDIVWRATTAGIADGPSHDEGAFIRAGLKEVFVCLPVFGTKPAMDGW